MSLPRPARADMARVPAPDYISARPEEKPAPHDGWDRNVVARGMIAARRLSHVRPSATVAMSTRARELRRAGRDIIALSAGQPDFPTPVHVCEAAAEAMARGETGYTNLTGTPELKSAIAASFRRTSGLEFAESEIIVSPGGKSVIAATLAATLSPGDEVIVPTPCWTSYPDMVRLFGGTPAPVAGGADFKITPEALDAAVTPRTRWLILNSPGNPTGAVYSANELSALAEVLRRHPHVWVMSDDIYSTVTFDVPFATLAAVAPDLAPRTLIVSGVSKSYSMTGWRVGWGVGPSERHSPHHFDRACGKGGHRAHGQEVVRPLGSGCPLGRHRGSH